jgi:hypothetical protein
MNMMMMGILVTGLFNTKIRQNYNSEYNKKLHLDFMLVKLTYLRNLGLLYQYSSNKSKRKKKFTFLVAHTIPHHNKR